MTERSTTHLVLIPSYNPGQKVFDTVAAALKFTGVLVVADEEAVLRRLEELLPVAADRSANLVVLRHRTSVD